MQVILTADVPNLGNMGDVVDVANGYGRNYLIPQQLAVQATKGNRRSFTHVKGQIDIQSARLREQALSMHERLNGASITLARRGAAEDKLYGSVTNRDVADGLDAAGFEVERRLIQMDRPIKELGIYEVPVKLHADVAAKVRVWVVKM